MDILCNHLSSIIHFDEGKNYTYFWELVSEEKMLMLQCSELSQQSVCYPKIILVLHYILIFGSIMIFPYIRHLLIKPSNAWLELQHLENSHPTTGVVKNLLQVADKVANSSFRHQDATKHLMGTQTRLIIQVNILILYK